MELSQPVDWLKKRYVGYAVNAVFSDENKEILEKLMQDIQAAFNDSVFVPPQDNLHITLIDWISPLVDYQVQDKDRLFAKVQPEYDKVFSEIVSSMKPITVEFNELRVSPNTIFIIGSDDGEFQKIRNAFVNKVELLPNTKLPPDIIHCSLARFTKVIDLSPVKTFAASKKISFEQRVTEFQLVNSHREPMLEVEILKRYSLGGV